jgi:hypothetical protein
MMDARVMSITVVAGIIMGGGWRTGCADRESYA